MHEPLVGLLLVFLLLACSSGCASSASFPSLPPSLPSISLSLSLCLCRRTRTRDCFGKDRSGVGCRCDEGQTKVLRKQGWGLRQHDLTTLTRKPRQPTHENSSLNVAHQLSFAHGNIDSKATTSSTTPATTTTTPHHTLNLKKPQVLLELHPLKQSPLNVRTLKLQQFLGCFQVASRRP